MTFRILDLIFATAWTGLLIGTFQQDLICFRQLLFFSLVSAGSTGMILSFSKSKRSQLRWGAAGGILASLVFAPLSFVFAYQFFDSTSGSMVPLVLDFQFWFGEMIVWLLLAAPLGSVMGPLLVMRVRQEKVADDFVKPFWISIALIGATFVFGFMAMDDRVTMQQPDRNWTPIQSLLLVAFIVHTLIWIKKRDS